MKSTSMRRRLVPAVAALALGLSVTACGAGNESEAGDGGGDAVTLDGGGATSQAKAQGVWRATYQDDSGNTVNYEEVGSGTGRENFNSGAYSFAGSDSYLNDDEGELSAAKERCNGEDPIEVPAYVSPIAVAARVSDDTGFFNLKATGRRVGWWSSTPPRRCSPTATRPPPRPTSPAASAEARQRWVSNRSWRRNSC